MENIGARVRWCRGRHGWTQRDLAAATGVGLATIRRIEQRAFAPRLETVRRLAARLLVREGWLAFGEAPMLGLADMTGEEQIAAQSGPSAEDLAGFAVVPGGVWYRDGGEWRVDKRGRQG